MPKVIKFQCRGIFQSRPLILLSQWHLKFRHHPHPINNTQGVLATKKQVQIAGKASPVYQETKNTFYSIERLTSTFELKRS
jgi:hypothetical protein